MIHLEGRGKNLKGIFDLLWALRKPKAKGVGSGSGEQKLWLWFKLGRGWGNSAVGWFSLFYLKPSEVSRTLAETLVLILVLFLIKKLTCCSVFTEADITVSQFSKSWNVAAGLSPNHYVLSCNITASFGDLTRTISCTSFWEEWAEVHARTHTHFIQSEQSEQKKAVLWAQVNNELPRAPYRVAPWKQAGLKVGVVSCGYPCGFTLFSAH